MPTVEYEHRFEYSYDISGKLYPRLNFCVSTAKSLSEPIDIDAFLDSGAELSLFNGWIGASLGIDILSGPKVVFETTAGSQLTGTLHPVLLNHLDLGLFEMNVAFSSTEIKRNLLGRDFFNLIQVGFREHHLAFLVSSNP